jgi:putative endopeptidase
MYVWRGMSVVKLAIISATWLALGCRPPARSGAHLEPPPESPPGSPVAQLRFDIGALDRSVDPCVDFYDYACGGWRRTHPIPPDRTRWSRYAELEARNLEHERALVEDAARRTGSTSAARVGAYYAACLDTVGIEARGLAPIRDLLEAIDHVERPADLAAVLAELHRRVAALLFSVSIDQDPRDAHHQVAMIDIGELGLDEPEDYTRADADAVAIRDAYRAHVERLLGLLGDRTPGRSPGDDARRVLELETALARALPAAADRRQAASRSSPLTLAELAAHAGAIDWRRYVEALGARGLAGANVAFVGYLDAVGRVLAEPDLSGVRAYLRYHVARAFAALLPRAIDDEIFGFSSRTLRGVRDMSPRWKRCLALVDRDIGDDVGRLFVATFFPEASRARARRMVDQIVLAFRAELAATPWLGQAARLAAIRKLENMRFTIGYSDRWKSYDALVLRRDDPIGNAERASELATARELGKLGHPPDRDEFFSLPQQLDGFGTKSLVSVGFTAGFLQPPVFDARLDDAVNFGGFGGVIGHEITHHFDDEGRRFDVDGNVRSWWSVEEVAAYEGRARCFVDEYAQFRIDDGTPVDGRLTLGENIADNGGLRLAWDALKPSTTGPFTDGFTPAQRFFLAWGQIRCENSTPEAARRQVRGDQHSPGRFRVDGVVSNMPEFAAAFACPSGARMAPATRCRIW